MFSPWWGLLRAGSAPLSAPPSFPQAAPGRSWLGTLGSPGKATLMCGAGDWAVAVGSPLSPPLPVSPPRLDLDDIPNAVRLVAPDVGILLVSSLSLCVCFRLGRASSRRNPESLEASAGVRATPTAMGTSHCHGDILPSTSHRDPATLPMAFPGHSLGLSMETFPVVRDPVWGSFGQIGGLGCCHTA